MSSSISSSSIGSLNPDQLGLALLKEMVDSIPRGATETFAWGGNHQDASQSPAVIVSLSEHAQAALQGGNTALQVLSHGAYKPPTQLQIPSPSTIGSSGDASATAAASSNGTSLLQQYLGMSAVNRFYAIASRDQITGGMTPDQRAAFNAAFDSRTLNVQDASDIPQLDDKETLTITNTAAGSGMSEAGSFNGAWATQHYGQNYVIFGTPYGGDMLISWGQSPTSRDTATSSVAQPAAKARGPAG